MQKIEAKFCTYLQKWIKYTLTPTFSFPWEAKIVRGYTFNLKQLAEHQKAALHQCKKTYSYKLSDYDRMWKPFDGFTFSECEYAFVVILFTKSKKFYFIDIDDIPDHSFKEEEAQNLYKFCGIYK